MSVKFHFVLAADLSSEIISLAGAGDESVGFSHVDVELPDGTLLGARSDSIGGKPPGVQIRPAGYTIWTRVAVFELAATPAQEAVFYDFLNAQIGKPYDITAIAAFIVGRDWRSEDAWFCSELAAAATEKAGLCDQLYLPVNKINPTTWAVVVSALGGVNQSAA